MDVSVPSESWGYFEPEGREYIGAMNAAMNCALANRQILAHLTRRVLAHYFPGATVETLFDVSHNTCKPERHRVGPRERLLCVHRKGATRALGPGHPSIPARYRPRRPPEPTRTWKPWRNRPRRRGLRGAWPR